MLSNTIKLATSEMKEIFKGKPFLFVAVILLPANHSDPSTPATLFALYTDVRCKLPTTCIFVEGGLIFM